MNWQEDDFSKEANLNFKMLSLFRKRLWPYVSSFRLLFFISLMLVLFATLASLLVPWLLGYIVDHVLVPKNTHLLIPLTFVILGTDFVGALTTYIQSYTFTLLGQKVLHNLRQDLLKKYEFYPLSEYHQTPTGRLVTRLINDTSSLQDLFTSGIAIALGNASVVLGIILWLIFLHPKLGLVCVSVFPFMILSSKLFGGIIRKTAHASKAALSRLNTFLAENISGMAIIQIFNRQGIFKKRFDETSHQYTQTQIKSIESFAFFQPSITILSSFSMSLLIWYGGFKSLDGSISLGLLVSFMAYLHALYAPIRDMTEKYNLFLSAMTSCERIFEFMDRPQEKESSNPSSLPSAIEGQIEFENVWFSYQSSKTQTSWVLKNINFKIEVGEKIGIVGYTGAGKTTLSLLLMRFYDVQKGKILLDRKDISHGERRTLRQKIGYIQQEPFLFSGTIEDNIFLWEEKGKEVFMSLPDFAREPFEQGSLKFSKEVLEKGANLSTGERQMISFMRTVVQNPSIFVLDEATAHLDPLSEQWIERLSGIVFRNKTVLIIAHRLATLKSVHRILVLHHGELVALGTHTELISKEGIYRKLYQLQLEKEKIGEN